MHLISSLLFALSANIDSFIVGMSYGIKKSDISLLKSTIISLVTLIGTIAAILMGTQISQFLPASSTLGIGCALLIGLGLYYILKALFGFIRNKIRKREVKANEQAAPLKQEAEDTALLTLREGLFLGLALGKTKMPRISDQMADVISGLILVGLGIYELLV